MTRPAVPPASRAARCVAPAEIAAPYDDGGERILTRRKVPCICPAQARGACGRTVDYSTRRGIVIEHVACDRCPRSWTRVNPQ